MVGMFSKPPKAQSPWSVGQPLNMNLPAAQASRVNPLPSIPTINIPTATSTVPSASMGAGGGDNMKKLLQMLQAYSTGA